MSAQVSTEELDQIVQTIEMFEVIAQANPQDTQTMEILKEAYWKVGGSKDAITISRKLADTYNDSGQYSSALLEYEGILQKQPDNPEILAMLGEVEAKLNQTSQTGSSNGADSGPINLDFEAVAGHDPTLITTNATKKAEGARAPQTIDLVFGDDGNEPLAKFIIQHRLAPSDVVHSALERVQKTNTNLTGQALGASLIDEISKSGVVNIEALLCGILDRSKFAYVPLDCYDVDRQVVKILPENLTLGRLIVPFDLISRTILIATANPFDALGKEAVQQLVDYNVQWHLAAPAAIFKVVREAYRLDARD